MTPITCLGPRLLRRGFVVPGPLLRGPFVKSL
jgi:hypothetical protein